ncbi:ankyrin repeat-containing domain protein [Obelidium mucronatum]|nr:ankyrin repeat-containing domain protein [Obelidium mucronatum]
MSLKTVLPEIAALITLQLETSDLKSLALATKSAFTYLILDNASFAVRHINHKLKTSQLSPIDYCYNFYCWRSVSYIYRRHFLQLILQVAKYADFTNVIYNIKNWPSSPATGAFFVQDLLSNPMFDAAVNNSALLQWACVSKWNTETIRQLLRHPSIDPAAGESNSFVLACRTGNVETVQLLLEDPRVDPLAQQNLALAVAAEHGQLEIVRLLLPNTPLPITDGTRRAIEGALYGGFLEIANLLGNRMNLVSIAYDGVLFHAMSQGNLEVIRFLLAKTKLGFHPSDPSIRRRFLLDYPNENFDDPQESLLLWSCWHGHEEFVDILLKKKLVADPSIRDNIAIRHASAGGFLGIVRLLLKCPTVDASADDNYAIRMACRGGHTETVGILLEVPGVNPCAMDFFAVKAAAAHGHSETLQVLLKDCRLWHNYYKVTPDCYAMQWATKRGYTRVIRILKEYQKSLDLCSICGKRFGTVGGLKTHEMKCKLK